MNDNMKFVHAAETDCGTVLGPDSVAIVVEGQGFKILMPQDDDVEISEFAQALVAAAMKIQSDDDFKEELLEAFT